MQGEEEKGSSGSIYGTAGKKHETQVYLQHHMHAQREGTGQRNKRERWRYLDTRHGDLPTKLQARQYLRNGILYIRVHVLHTCAHAPPHTYVHTPMHLHTDTHTNKNEGESQRVPDHLVDS